MEGDIMRPRNGTNLRKHEILRNGNKEGFKPQILGSNIKLQKSFKHFLTINLSFLYSRPDMEPDGPKRKICVEII